MGLQNSIPKKEYKNINSKLNPTKKIRIKKIDE
jgi:hypothetical protein